MPIYAYRCNNCGVQFERQQKFSDPVLKKCPECNKSALQKLYTPVGIVFKGSGFYATDHRSPSGSSTNVQHNASKSDEKTTSSTSNSKSSSEDKPTTSTTS